MVGDFFVQVEQVWSGPGVGWPSLKTPIVGPEAKSQKKFNLEDFQNWIWTN